MDNFDVAKEILCNRIEELFPIAKRSGDERIMKCPFRVDNNPSLSINISKRTYIDSADNTFKGSILDLYAQMNNMSAKDAMIEVIQRYGTETQREALRTWSPERKRGKMSRDDLTPIVPIPSYRQAEGETLIRKKPGFNAIYKYMDKDGALLYYRYRCIVDGKKKIRSFGLFSDNNGEYRFMGYDPMKGSARPLYGLWQLSDVTVKKILIVEGEKAADAARAVLNNWIVLGTNGESGFKSNKIDDILELNLPVYVWPDNDNSGVSQRSARDMCHRLQEKDVYYLTPTDDMENKDDVYDWLQRNDAARLEEYIYANSESAKQAEKKDGKQRPFTPLGYDADSYYYIAGRTGQIISIPGSQHTSQQLTRLARLAWFEANYSIWKKDEEVIDWKWAADAIMDAGDKIGPYDSEKVRGRGVWRDNRKNVLFDGEFIHVGSEKTGLLDYESNYSYGRVKRLEYFPKVQKMDLNILDDFIDPLQAGNPGQLKYLLGWCVTSLLCGVLEWRSHIWIHGESGSGKSTVLDEIIVPLVGKIGYHFKGNSTEAGIRQTIGNDARPAVIDDISKQGEKNTDRVDKILELMRNTSTTDDATTAKGTASQKAINKHIKTMLAVTSVVEYAENTEDKNRITPIEMRSKGSMTLKEYNKYLMTVHDHLENGIADYLRLSTIQNIDTILKNIKTFKLELSDVVTTSRDADQLAPLVAGYYHIKHEGETATEAALPSLSSNLMSQSSLTEQG